LRQSTGYSKGRGLSSPSIAILAWLRNTVINLFALVSLLGASVLIAKLALKAIDFMSFPAGLYGLSALVSAVLLGVLSRRSEEFALSPPTQLRTSLMALVLIIFAAVLLNAATTITPPGYSYKFWTISGLSITAFCLSLGFPRTRSLRILVANVSAATAAGVLVGLLAFLITHENLWPRSSFLYGADLIYEPYLFVHQSQIQLTVPLVVFVEVLAFLLYALIVRRWFSRGVRELFWRLCRTLAGLASLWLIVAVIWNFYLSLPVLIGLPIAAVVLTCGGLLKAAGVGTKSRLLGFLFDTMERLGPYAFVIGLTAIVAELLGLFALNYGPYNRFIEIVAVAVLTIISLLLLWLTRVNEFTMHRLHRSRIVRNYLSPASRTSEQRTGGNDMDLSDLASAGPATGPYPLFGAALDVADVDPAFLVQTRTVPFLFSPHYSGFERFRTRAPKSDIAGAYRPTKQLGGGISLATAMAVSQPFHNKSRRPPTSAVAMFWTIFDMRDGRFMGNPLRNDTWHKRGPLLEPLYALREGSGDLANEASYIRPTSGQEFDQLGIYQLVKRRCRFIIACDATKDPDFSFENLGATIRRCRTELGVEIQMDLGPLGRTHGTSPVTSSSHCQIALIRYSKDVEGLMIYIKPSLTGDEPADLGLYAKAHPEFPAADIADGNFGESDFESYQRLGQHIVESLLADTGISDKAPTSEVFRLIRTRLQPDFKEPETTPAPAAEAAVAVPQELVDAIASGECVLCAGSGLAAQAKLPTWPAFLEGLLRFARENGLVDAAGAAGIAATLAAGELEAAADELTHQVPPDLLLEYVRFATASQPSAAHSVLAEMKFLGALNTNIDDLLGTAFNSRVLVPAQVERLVGALQSKRFFVANLVGSASQPSSLLFTMKEFRLLLSANSQFKQFLGTLFLRYTIVFVGSGIDGIRDYLEALELPQTPDRRHYAIIPNAGQIDPVTLRFLERSYNIKVIDFQPQFNFAGLPAFLKQLQIAVKENAPQPKANGALTLKSVTLNNIGPFHSLQVDFTPSWNLLLGDNGVGKTVLLKSIAAALSGEQADPDAVTRLLRSGATSGSIRLRVENREYTVELKRAVDGSVQIASASLSPIKYDSWLVLGFPALRSVPLRRPKGPGLPKPEAPSAEDLLPILRGEPDDRIADIKQWLVNLDYAAKSEPSPSRSRRLFNDFFKVLQRLTPDLRLEPGSINSKTMEITVVTDAGVVPLEAISQGTGSVMCWIGTLLERLSETGNARNSGESSALVLIDELDAHMHPKWQQMFVEAFRHEFKSVQIIATTHSPLLVGSLTAEEIWLVHRAPLKSEIYGVAQLKEGTDGVREIVILGPEDDPEDGQPSTPREERRYLVSSTEALVVDDGEIVEKGEALTKGDIRVEAERIKMKEPGWRIDQILTSPLFELETTRDPETARMLSEYTRLTALEKRSEADNQRLSEIAENLQIRLPTPGETKTARMAYDLISSFATKSLSDLSEQTRTEVLTEVKAQLTESITGSRRPE
jgi:hypothetical protein